MNCSDLGVSVNSDSNISQKKKNNNNNLWKKYIYIYDYFFNKF